MKTLQVELIDVNHMGEGVTAGLGRQMVEAFCAEGDARAFTKTLWADACSNDFEVFEQTVCQMYFNVACTVGEGAEQFIKREQARIRTATAAALEAANKARRSFKAIWEKQEDGSSILLGYQFQTSSKRKSALTGDRAKLNKGDITQAGRWKKMKPASRDRIIAGMLALADVSQKEIARIMEEHAKILLKGEGK